MLYASNRNGNDPLELAEDEAAYRSITLSWFEHSPLFEALKRMAGKENPIDHHNGSWNDSCERTKQKLWDKNGQN